MASDDSVPVPEIRAPFTGLRHAQIRSGMKMMFIMLLAAACCFAADKAQEKIPVFIRAGGNANGFTDPSKDRHSKVLWPQTAFKVDSGSSIVGTLIAGRKLPRRVVVTPRKSMKWN